MTEIENSDTQGMRKVIRPVLIASERNAEDDTTFLRRLLVGLADESLSVALVCPPDCDRECVVPAPVEVFTHPLVDLPVINRLGIEQLEEQLEKFKPTILHCLCESRAALTRRLARRLDVPYVLAINSMTDRLHGLSISARRCMKIVVPAETIRTSATRDHFRFADRIRPIKVGTFVRGDARCFSDPSCMPSMVVAHPLDRVSDFASFLAAVKALRAEGREFMVVLMGTGRAEHRLWRLLEHEGLSETVTIVPPLNPWRSVLAAGDIFVQPQPTPRFSMFLLEAMSVGAVVAACQGGVDDLIVHNRTALVFEPGSEISIRQTLARLLDDHEFARQLAARAREYLLTCHSVSEMVSTILDTYSEAQQRYASQAVPA
jgi:glycosyltransferase involved in cell wall biosynthesis